MKRKMLGGTTGFMLAIFVNDSSGNGLSVAFNAAGLVAEYRRMGQSTWTAITLSAGTLGTWSSGGWVADGALTGAYEVGIPDAAVASGARAVLIRFRGAASMMPVLCEIELDAINYQDNVRAGLSALPNAAAAASGGLLTVGTSSGQLSPSAGKIAATLAAGDVSGNLPGADTAGTTTLLSRLTSTRAGLLDNLDAAVSSRLSTGGYTAPPTAATIAAAILVTPAQKLVTDASGYVTAGTVSDKTGYKLAADGVDQIITEAGLNLRQASSIQVAACAGTVSGAGTGTVVIKGAGVNVTRITATTDNSGNRSAVTLAVPA